ncbi:MAG: hypothetical protein J5645_07875 [Lachnospiraceae bacterium]|nr:hypothetical protein [Lachnospiraceae bacterium]
MKKEDLADAVGGICESDLIEVDEVRNAPRLTVVRGGSWKKRMWILVAVCVFVLATGFACKYLMNYTGKVELDEKQTPDGETRSGYLMTVKAKDAMISWSELTGEIQNILPDLADQLARAALIPRQSEPNEITNNPDYPEGIERTFATASDAAAFIGYAGLKTPVVDLGNGSRSKVYISGSQGEQLPWEVKVSIDHGEADSGIYAYTTIQLNIADVLMAEGRNGEDDVLTNGYYFSRLQPDDLTLESVEVNGREFKVVKGRELTDAAMGTLVSWIENRALYTLWIIWPEEQAEAANAAMLSWMQSF